MYLLQLIMFTPLVLICSKRFTQFMIFSVRDYVGVGTTKLRRTRRHLSLLCAGNNSAFKGTDQLFSNFNQCLLPRSEYFRKKNHFFKICIKLHFWSQGLYLIFKNWQVVPLSSRNSQVTVGLQGQVAQYYFGIDSKMNRRKIWMNIAQR